MGAFTQFAQGRAGVGCAAALPLPSPPCSLSSPRPCRARATARVLRLLFQNPRSQPEARLALLPDQMYLVAPANIEAASRGQQQVVLEFGGRLRARPGGFQRVTVTYSCASGSVVEATHEVY